MSASPLTDDTWPGLPLLQCDMDPGLHRIFTETPVLIFRHEPGLTVELAPEDGRSVRFRQAALRFDLFASGLHMDAVSDRPGTKSFVVALPPTWLANDGGDFDATPRLRSRFQFADGALRRLVWRLNTHHQHGAPLGADYCKAVSRGIVDRLVGLQIAEQARHPDSTALDSEACRLVDALIDDRLQDPPSAAAMAATLGIGVVRFVREFKLAFGATPHRHVQRRRLVRARELLAHTDATVTQVALDSGFANHAHFSTVFRAATGMTPSGFRKAEGTAGRSRAGASGALARSADQHLGAPTSS